MIERYSLPEMAAVWSEEHRLAVWQEIEALVVEAWAAEGVAPAAAAAAVRAAPEVDRDAWKAREAETGHDLAAFVDVLAGLGRPGRGVGALRADLVRRARHRPGSAARRRRRPAAGAARRPVRRACKRRALEHRDTLMVGRTHGMWAEPTTFGLELAGWAFEVHRNQERLRAGRRPRWRWARSAGRWAPTPTCRPRWRPSSASASAWGWSRPPPRWWPATATPPSWGPWPWSAPCWSASPSTCATCSAPRWERSSEAFGAGAEGVVGHAPQAQPHRRGEHHRPRPPAAGLRLRRPGGRGPVGRAGHQPLLGGAGGPARRLPGGRLRPRPHDPA